MSDALNYLLKVRQDAMRSYFDFIKKSRSSLDPKTSAIISVITKVDKQTKTGFCQYLRHALQTGVTADEIIDALFAAFPTLGLTKIVWAIDIILAMEIPEFNPESLGQNKIWYDVTVIDALKEGGVTYIAGKRRSFFIYYENEIAKVFDSHCPHQATNIPKLALKGCMLTCPKHQWKFNMKTGECVEKGNHSLNRLESRIVENRLEVYCL